MDVYLPEHPTAVVMYIHGGAWVHGDRTDGPDMRRYYAEEGIAMVSVDYRLAPQHRWPAQLEDVSAGLDWVIREAPHWGVEPARLGLWGVSAGGHLAAMLALARPADVRCAVLGYPATDLPAITEGLEGSPEQQLVGEDEPGVAERLRLASPVSQDVRNAPPMLIQHGFQDSVLSFRQALSFYHCLAAAGRDATLQLIDGFDHAFVNDSTLEKNPDAPTEVYGTTSWLPESPSYATIGEFFHRHLGE